MQTTRRPKAWTPRGFPPNARHAEITEVLRSETVEACRDSRRARREAVFVGAMLCAIVAASVGGSWFYSIRTARENFEARLTGFASAAALQVDPALHGLIRHPSQVDGPEYRRAVAPLRRMRAAIPEIRFLYTIVRDGEDVRIILDAADPGDLDRDGIEDRPNVWELSVSPQLAKQYALGWRGQPPRVSATEEPYRDKWGTFMSGYAPFYDSAGRLAGAVGVDVDASAYVEGLAQARRGLMLGLIPAGLLVIGLAVAAYRLRLSALSAARTLRRTAAAASAAARQDRLTSLANRTAFVDELNAALDRVRDHRQRCCAVLFLDFDHFKFINDTLGHEAGDELLRQISERLRAALQTDARIGEHGNVVARFGGDEFVVLLNRPEHAGGVAAVTNGLLAALAPPYVLNGSEVRSSASIGVSTSGRRLYDAETMLRHADVAMYQAKQSGRACYVLFDEAMQARLTRRLKLEADLLRVLDTDQLTVVYEPIVELDTGRRVAAEATVRWQHPELGEVPRQELFEIAEESGLIVTLGDWALREACRQQAEWRRAAPASAPAFVSLNLSRAEISLGSRLIDRVRGVLAETELPAQCLQLEIPQRVATDTRGSVGAVLDSLRTCGVRLSMDGFGTGTSSLSCLRSHAFDSVKVAQSSMRDLASNRDALALAHATLTLLENLGMQSVAEGVEDPAQLAVLQSLGCRYAQGRFFSDAVPAAQFLSSWTRPSLARGNTGEFAQLVV